MVIMILPSSPVVITSKDTAIKAAYSVEVNAMFQTKTVQTATAACFLFLETRRGIRLLICGLAGNGLRV
jgi:hypothetical protein